MAQLNNLIVTGSSRFLVDINGNLNGNAATASVATQVVATAENPNSTSLYYVPFVVDTGNQSILGNDGIRFSTRQGTTSTIGSGYLVLGNDKASGTAGNKAGSIRLYGQGKKYADITYGDTVADNTTHYLPDTGGTILNSGTTYYTNTITKGTEIGTIVINGAIKKIHAPGVSTGNIKIGSVSGTSNSEQICTLSQNCYGYAIARNNSGQITVTAFTFISQTLTKKEQGTQVTLTKTSSGLSISHGSSATGVVYFAVIE